MKNNKVGIIDYGVAGNIFNIAKAIESVGGHAGVIQIAEDFDCYDKYVLPGVGSFPDAMKAIVQKGLYQSLVETIKSKPTLGICLGMQIMVKVGFEHEETRGLGLIDGEVRPVSCNGKVPHMGFSNLDIVADSPLLNKISNNDQFYFMHSYEVVNYTNVIALSEYVGHTFVSSFQKDKLFGVQFHPEKSRQAGIQIFKNFLTIG